MESAIAAYLSELTARLEARLGERLVAAWVVAIASYHEHAPELAATTEARARAWETEGRWISKGEARRHAAQGSITLPGSGRSSSGAWL